MLLSKGHCLMFFPLFLMLPSLYAQSPGNGEIDPVSFVGLTLDELIGRYGAPRSVRSARGIEEWQDDVIFVYENGDFYVYKDRVWQVGLKAARGIKAGDSRAVVSLVLGSGAESRENSLFLPINEGAWPLMLRCDFNENGNARIIYIYRTDF